MTSDQNENSTPETENHSTESPTPAPPQTDPDPLPEALGPFQVITGAWRENLEESEGGQWIWTGTIAAYETGELELPAITVVFPGENDGSDVIAISPALQVTIESVLDDGRSESDESSIADLKGPASIAPDYALLLVALWCLAGLIVAALTIRYLERRYGHRLVAAVQPEDPFNRMLPHEWAYQALQALLDGGNAVPEKSGLFFEEVARILKLYFSGRFRVELMETVTSDVPAALLQTGVDRSVLDKIEKILQRCDLVKFAGERSEPGEFRQIVESSYALVDETRPTSSPPSGAVPEEVAE